jgi:hypothetical protein
VGGAKITGYRQWRSAARGSTMDLDAGPCQVQLPRRGWPTLAKDPRQWLALTAFAAPANKGTCGHHGVRDRSDARSDHTSGRRAG